MSMEDFRKDLSPGSSVDHVVAVLSGKGGVGKSLVCALMASELRRMGYEVAVMDADITGPSIPKAFGVKGPVTLTQENLMLPPQSETGIKMLSSNLLLGKEEDPVIVRGPVIAGMVTQFWTDTDWGHVDYMLIDMPPGTGDVPLTVFQSLPAEYAVMVTSPQELAAMVVKKAVNMANKMDIDLLGVVENMSYYVCPDCGKQHQVFGPSHIEEISAGYGLSVLSRIPIDPEISKMVDNGNVYDIDPGYIRDTVKALLDAEKS
ncbi:MAG: Mrp/NBP35 family ATP-binding protein [Lachnospiraceae bacterium]|nr:Mrp/NBP35 family ATP-binding protein [Lachnospiraceae bacterium]